MYVCVCVYTHIYKYIPYIHICKYIYICGMYLHTHTHTHTHTQHGAYVVVVKSPPANAGDMSEVSSVPRLGRSHGGRQGNPL